VADKKNSIGLSRLSVRDNTSRTNNAVESLVLRCDDRSCETAHANLFAFLRHLQRTTEDSQPDIAPLHDLTAAADHLSRQEKNQHREPFAELVHFIRCMCQISCWTTNYYGHIWLSIHAFSRVFHPCTFGPAFSSLAFSVYEAYASVYIRTQTFVFPFIPKISSPRWPVMCRVTLNFTNSFQRWSRPTHDTESLPSILTLVRSGVLPISDLRWFEGFRDVY